MNLYLRNVNKKTASALSELAERRGMSRNDLLIEILENHVAANADTAAQTIAGFVRVDICADVAPDDDCDWCDQPFLHGEQYLVIRRDNVAPAVVCRVCATDYGAGS